MKIVKVQKIHHQKVMLHALEESCYCQCPQPPEFSFEEIPRELPNEFTHTIADKKFAAMKVANSSPEVPCFMSAKKLASQS